MSPVIFGTFEDLEELFICARSVFEENPVILVLTECPEEIIYFLRKHSYPRYDQGPGRVYLFFEGNPIILFMIEDLGEIIYFLRKPDYPRYDRSPGRDYLYFEKTRLSLIRSRIRKGLFIFASLVFLENPVILGRIEDPEGVSLCACLVFEENPVILDMMEDPEEVFYFRENQNKLQAGVPNAISEL